MSFRLWLLFCTFLPNLIWGQLVTDNAVNASDGVQNILLGGGIIATNITFSGTNEQIGAFTCNGGCNLNIASGIVMATGNIDATSGNSSGSTSLGPAAGFGASDVDLEELGGSTYNDAAILEFDFVPQGDSLVFNFVFGSEEYPEFVNGGFNDAFGFFISGPGIAGPFSNNAANIALVPGTTTPVTIDNVNAGSNAQYFIANGGTGTNVIEADGFTTVLQAYAQVQCGASYHIKLAIADAVDTGYDSYVFLEAGSFASNQVVINFLEPSLSPMINGIYEGCSTAFIEFIRPLNQNDPAAYAFSFAGAALPNIDFDMGNDSLVFAQNQSTVSLSINGLSDAITEGLENLVITIEGLSVCGVDPQIEFFIADLPALEVVSPSIEINCGMQAVLTPMVSGGLGNYQIIWQDGSITPSFSTYPTAPGQYSFTVTDTCGVDPVSGQAVVTFATNDPVLVDLGGDFNSTCIDPITLTAAPIGGFGVYSYNWTINNVQVSNSNSLSFTESEDIAVEVQVTDACGVMTSDQIEIHYPIYPIALEMGADLSGTCIDEFEIQPSISGGVGTYSYAWTTQNNGLIGSSSSLIVQTAEDMEIALTVVDQCGNEAADFVEIVIPQISMTVDIGPDILTTCAETLNLESNINGGVGNYSIQWIYNESTIATSNNTTLMASGDGLITCVVEDQCGNSASDLLAIQVPPVPVFVELGPNMVSNCITNNQIQPDVTGGVGNFSYAWYSAGELIGNQSILDVQSSTDLLVELQVLDQCGNSQSDQIWISIPPVPIAITVSPDTLICKNETVQLFAQGVGGVGNLNYAWDGLSTNLSTIEVAPMNTTTYTIHVADQCGNHNQSTISVEVVDIRPQFTYAYEDEFSIAFTNQTSPAYSIYWVFSDGSISFEENPVHTFTDLNFWHATLVAESEGCKKSVEDTFYPNGNLFVPNCFTPDHDGINDQLFVIGHDLIAFHWTIYNRYGELVFETTDLTKPWDGSHHGQSHYAPDGYYHYIIVAVDQRGNSIEKKGSVLILR